MYIQRDDHYHLNTQDLKKLHSLELKCDFQYIYYFCNIIKMQNHNIKISNFTTQQ